MGQAGGEALAAFIERSRTLTSLKVTNAWKFPWTCLAAALAHCRTLTSLELNIGSKCSMETVRALAAFVQQTLSALLTALKLRFKSLEDADVAVLAAAVAHSRSLTDLQLGWSSMSDAGVEALTAALEQSGCIRKLYLDCAGFGSVGAVALARLLVSDRCALTSLTLFHDIVPGNRIGREGALALSEALHTSRTLTELRLISTGFDDDDIAALLSALQRNPHCRLRALDLSRLSLSVRHGITLAGMMGHSVTLERLELRRCDLGNEAMVVLAAGIAHNPSLQHLNVSSNKFGAAGAMALAAAVNTCPALTSLDVSNNEIGDAGMAALAPSLDNVRLLHLYLCGLTLASAKPLADLVQRSRVLMYLDVSSNILEARGVSEIIAAALQPPSSLRSLHIRSGAESADGADGIVALADALCRGWKATELWLDREELIHDQCALALVAVMEQLGDCCTLTELLLAYYSLTVEGALALVRAATQTPRLRKFDLRFGRSLSSAERLALLAACGPQPNFELSLAD